MALADQFDELPANLSRQAVDDLIRILRRSAREFGVVVARRSRERLLARVRSVADGTAIGHRRQDVRPRRDLVAHIGWLEPAGRWGRRLSPVP